MNCTRQQLPRCLRATPLSTSSVFPGASATASASASASAPQQQQQHQQQQRRSVSSFRRSQKMLRVQPSTDHFSKTTASQDHIVYNPPSSSPNVYHTPLKFLPPNDPRRRLHALAAAAAAAASTSSAQQPQPASRLPPPVRPIQDKKYHLSAADVDEIRRLRAEDPRQWTRVRLAEKFGCSQFFVSLCASAPEVAEERKRELEEIKKRWGRAKTEAREDRQRRKELWGRE